MSIKDKIIKIGYELKDRFSGQVSKITGSIKKIGKESDKTTKKLERNNKRAAGSFNSLAAAATKARGPILALAAIFVGIVSGIKKWTAAAATQERAEVKLETTLRNLTDASVEQVEALKDQSAALQELTGYGDEQIISAQAMLATFKLTAEQIGILTPSLLDMGEAARKSGADHVDLETIAIAVGKAFSSGIGSLSRYGVAMTDAQKEAFKLADQQGKVQIVSEVLQDNFEGLAEAVGKTYEGAVRKADAAQGDFSETLGQTFTENKDFVDFINRMGQGWVSLGESVKSSSREIQAGLSFVFRSIQVFSGAVKTAFNFLQIGIKGTFAVINDSLALFALGLSKITFGSVSDEFERVADSLAASSAELKKSLSDDYFKDIGEGASQVVEGFEGIDKAASSTAKSTRNLSSAGKELTKTLKEEEEAANKAADAAKTRSEALSKALKDGERAIKRDLQSAKDVSREFQSLIEEMRSGPEKEGKDLTLIDFSASITNARDALSEGDYSGAIEGARDTAEMLRKMKEAGTESDLVLAGLAARLKRVADEAAAGQINEDQTVVGNLKKQIENPEGGAPQMKVTLDLTEAEAQLAALTKKASEPIRKPVIYETAGGYSDRPQMGDNDVRREALKRGKR